MPSHGLYHYCTTHTYRTTTVPRTDLVQYVVQYVVPYDYSTLLTSSAHSLRQADPNECISRNVIKMDEMLLNGEKIVEDSGR